MRPSLADKVWPSGGIDRSTQPPLLPLNKRANSEKTASKLGMLDDKPTKGIVRDVSKCVCPKATSVVEYVPSAL